jgi:tetratricopeptide (TPR) repeat protein
MRVDLTPGFLSLLVVCLALVVGSYAQQVSPRSEFEAANRLYEQGLFAEAAAAYETILASGLTSAAVHYNLANAHFRSSHLGLAISQYRQALALAPRDPDIRANLKFARQQVAGTSSVRHRLWLRQLHQLRLNEWTLLTFAALCLTSGLLIVGHWQPARRRRLRPCVLLGAFFTTTFLAASATLWHHQHQAPLAVALRSSFPIRYGPLSESQVHFTVSEGTELTVEDTQDDWVQVVDATQRRGWTQRDMLWIPGQ